jgi:hypothetical protein
MKLEYLNALQLTANPDLDGYATAKKTPTDLAGYPKITIADFKVGLKWQHARQIGTENTGTDVAPVWEPRYEMINRTVTAPKINQDLLDFQNSIKDGNGYIMTTAPYADAQDLTPEEQQELIDELQNVKRLSPEDAQVDIRENIGDQLALRPSYIYPDTPPADEGISDAQAQKNIEKARQEKEQEDKDKAYAREEHLETERILLHGSATEKAALRQQQAAEKKKTTNGGSKKSE